MGLTPRETGVIEFLKNGEANSQSVLENLNNKNLNMTSNRTHRVIWKLIDKGFVGWSMDSGKRGMEYIMYFLTEKGRNQLTK